MSDVAVAPDRPAVAPPRSGGAGRPIRRRAALPTGRAVVGGFLVAVAVVAVFTGAQRAARGPTTSYVVARSDLPVGTRLPAAHLAHLRMDLPETLARSAAFTREADLVGATTVGPIRAGELVQAGAVVAKRSGPTDLELSFAIEADRAVAGSLRPGERVDVLATFGSGSDSYTVVVVHQAHVLSIARDGGALAGDGEVVRLAVPTSGDALALTHEVNAGEVTLVRSTGTAGGQVGETYRAPAAEPGSTARNG
jgi:Flp pilus assembly protein CpaB